MDGPEAPRRDRRAEQLWGGYALGIVFVAIGLVMGVTGGGQWPATGLGIGGVVILGIQSIWMLWTRRRDRRPRR